MMPINPKTVATVDFPALLREGAVLLDVRTAEEYCGFHLPGAVNMPCDELERSLDVIRSWKRPVIVYSSHRQHSRLAFIKLHSRGVSVFDGGSREDLSRRLLEC